MIMNSVAYLMEQAEKGNLDAQHAVGACYATGDWDGEKDEAEAVKWYTRAAEAGHSASQYDLGFMLLLGEGTEKDVQKGLWWLEQAVANGASYAASLLADIYTNGRFELAVDMEKARYWNARAGEYRNDK